MDSPAAVLRNHLQDVPDKSRDFALSLLSQLDKGKTLSPKQWYWVERLAKEAVEPPTPTVASVEVGDFHQVVALFEQAKAHLKYPKIALKVGQFPLVLAVSGSKSSAPGTINVTDGGPYGQGTWYGRVTPSGEWQVNLRAPPTALQEVEDFLMKFAAKPAETASEYGRLTGSCCFCNKLLTDPQSVAAGFGQTCAKHFGLLSQWQTAQPVLKDTA